MKPSTAIAPFWEISRAMSYGLVPTVLYIIGHPFILLHPVSLSQIFFAYVWVLFGPGSDEGGYDTKTKLLTPHASGIVVDLGAGYGVTVFYLQRDRVTKYVAVEPNKRMHSEIRRNAAQAGYAEEKGELIILSCGAQDFETINGVLGGPNNVDTIISVLTFCSVPSPRKTISNLMTDTLKPGGQLLYYEHVQSPRADVSVWQSFWTPIWSLFFDGCCLNRPTHLWIEALEWDWQASDMWGKEGEPEENIWWHRAGRYTKPSNLKEILQAKDSELQKKIIKAENGLYDLKREKTELAISLKDAKARIQPLQAKVTQVESQLTASDAKLRETETRLELAESSRLTLEKELQDLRQQVQDTEHQLKLEQAKASALTNQIKDGDQHSAGLVERLVALETEKVGLQSAIEAVKAEIMKKSSNAEGLETTVKSLQTQLADSTSERARLSTELESLRMRQAEQDKTLGEAEAKAKLLATQTEELQNSAKSLKAHLTESEEEKARLTTKVEALTSSLAERDRSLEESKTEAAASDSEKADALAEASSKFNALQAENTSLTQKLEQSEASAATLAQEISEKQAQITTLEAAREALDQTIKDVEANMSKANKNIESLESEKRKLEAQLKAAEDGYNVPPVVLNEVNEGSIYPTRAGTAPTVVDKGQKPVTPPASPQLHPRSKPSSEASQRSHRGSLRFPSFTKGGSNKKIAESAGVHSFEVVNRGAMPHEQDAELGHKTGSFRRRISAVFHTDRPKERGNHPRRASEVGSLQKPVGATMPTETSSPSKSVTQRFHQAQPSL
ncbi:hypothetical protein FRB95_011517 [Tulasnella sp. JGI-2019a]|nr:hypothetical protein FRB95_011517 [Tulasnella sp. JGI-2019a]